MKRNMQAIVHEGSKLRLRVGERVQLELLGTGIRFRGELIGDKPGRFFIVWLPPNGQYRKALVGDNVVSVRALGPNYEICGFNSLVSHVMPGPYSLLFLEYPERFEMIPLRGEERMDCMLPVVMIHDSREYGGVIVNLSMGGAMVALDADSAPDKNKIPTGAEVYLLFKIGGDGRDNCAKAAMRVEKTIEDKSTYGLEFIDLIGGARGALESFLGHIKQFSSPKP